MAKEDRFTGKSISGESTSEVTNGGFKERSVVIGLISFEIIGLFNDYYHHLFTFVARNCKSRIPSTASLNSSCRPMIHMVSRESKMVTPQPLYLESSTMNEM